MAQKQYRNWCLVEADLRCIFHQFQMGVNALWPASSLLGQIAIAAIFFTNKPTQFVPGVGEFLLVWKENRGELFFFVVSHEKYYVNKQSFFNHRISTCITFCIVQLANYLIRSCRTVEVDQKKTDLKKNHGKFPCKQTYAWFKMIFDEHTVKTWIKFNYVCSDLDYLTHILWTMKYQDIRNSIRSGTSAYLSRGCRIQVADAETKIRMISSCIRLEPRSI